MKERRESVRVTIDASAPIEAHIEKQSFTGSLQVLDISEGGLGCSLSDRFGEIEARGKNAEIYLSLKLLGGNTFHVKGRIAYLQKEEGDSGHFGIEFIDLKKDALVEVKKYVTVREMLGQTQD